MGLAKTKKNRCRPLRSQVCESRYVYSAIQKMQVISVIDLMSDGLALKTDHYNMLRI